ncbi:esterase-like activity of phytase family protein [uncultured Tateyamaria sp.]|uniref:esterase-like activity of phytase family protein n=1 Tax=uncultured Tateyamaria sp. TaxID=455651 RepID=UPI002633F314|nr:esterase-like activity of phytase family protein [uncultured Tateyamaria sp.]
MRWRLSLALIASATASPADPLTHLRNIPLTGLGGISAIEVEADGAAALVLSDRGTGHRFAISRNESSGRISDIRAIRLPFPDRDTEGLAISGADVFISYEDPGNISTLNGDILPSPREFNALPRNGALEALAATPDGVIYTIPENPRTRGGPIPIYRFAGDRWSVAAALPRAEGFRPTGADFGPDGLLYVLERSFSPLGFRTRIRRIDLQADPPVAETLLKTSLGTHDNLEGISVWRSNSGATCLSMVSDNNFLSVQASELIEYALTETLAGGARCD